MKTKLFFSLFSIFISVTSFAQTTETFEDETQHSTSFTDNGQVFNITSQAGGTFDIYYNATAYGWNGTVADRRFIDNTTFAKANVPVGFTISSAGAVPFNVISLWVYLSTNTLTSLGSGGGITFVGKLGGVTQFTANATSGFNTNPNTANGWSLINFASFGGADNTAKNIDQLVITTSGVFAYACIDAFKWKLGTVLSTDNITRNSKNLVYPNPTTGIINLKNSQNIGQVQVYSLEGKLLKTQTANSNEAQVDITNLPKGVYMLKTTAEGNATATQKIIKE